MPVFATILNTTDATSKEDSEYSAWLDYLAPNYTHKINMMKSKASEKSLTPGSTVFMDA